MKVWIIEIWDEDKKIWKPFVMNKLPPIPCFPTREDAIQEKIYIKSRLPLDVFRASKYTAN